MYEQRLPLGASIKPKNARLWLAQEIISSQFAQCASHITKCVENLKAERGHGRFPQLKSDLESSITIPGKTIFSRCTSDGNKAEASVASAFFSLASAQRRTHLTRSPLGRNKLFFKSHAHAERIYLERRTCLLRVASHRTLINFKICVRLQGAEKSVSYSDKAALLLAVYENKTPPPPLITMQTRNCSVRSRAVCCDFLPL